MGVIHENFEIQYLLCGELERHETKSLHPSSLVENNTKNVTGDARIQRSHQNKQSK